MEIDELDVERDGDDDELADDESDVVEDEADEAASGRLMGVDVRDDCDEDETALTLTVRVSVR